jgi:tetratricopeptide (TPR) repeat protein
MTVTLLAAVAALIVLVAVLMWFGIRRRPSSVAARGAPLLAKAEAAHNAGRLDAADRAYRRVAEALEKAGATPGESDSATGPDPAETRGRALVGVGEIASRQGRSADAIAAFREAFTLTVLPASALELIAADATRHAAPDPLDLSVCVSLVVRADTDPDHFAHEFLQARCTVTPGLKKAQIAAVEQLAARIEQGAPRIEWAIFGRACALRELGRAHEATAAFERAQALLPRAATGYELGRLYRDAGRPDDALAAFERSLTIEPERPEVLYAMALTHLRRTPEDSASRRTALEAAVGLLSRTCVLAPQHAQAWLGLGRARHALGHPRAALEPLAKAAELLPRTVEVQVEYVELTLAQGERAGAFTALRRVLAADPKHLRANLMLGTLHDEDGDFAAARPCFERVVALRPDDARGRFGLGRALFELGDPERAAHQLAAVRGRDAAQHELLGRAYSAAGDPTAADTAFADAIAEGADNATVHHRHGCVRLRAGRRADAIVSFGRVLDRVDADSPQAAEALLFRGIAHREEGDLPAARADADAAIEAAPGDARAHYARGCLAVAENEWTLAQREFALASRIDPDYAPARFGLGLVREHAGDHAGAVDAYAGGLERRPDWTPATVRLGAAAIAAGRVADGVEILGAVSSEPSGSARFHLALGYARLGRVERADELWAAPGGVDDAIRRHNVATARDLLARAALSVADHAGAREHWQACHDAFPDHEGYQVALAETLFREGAELLRLGRDRQSALGSARDRLGAAVALVPGDRRVRVQLAMAALYAGEPAVAVRLLAALDPAASSRVRHLAPLARLALGAGTVALEALSESEPAAWAVRGMQAARARRWADAAAAYRRALTEPGPREPEAVAAICEAAACVEPARAACGQCGRTYCADHGVLAPDLPSRCGTCADAILTALTACSREAGTDRDNEEALARWARGSGRTTAHHLLALLRAQGGAYDAALAALAPVLGTPEADPQGRLIAARVYLHRAAASSADLNAASADVERAAHLEPELAAVRTARPLLRGRQALVLSRAGRHDEALAIRFELERAAPTDVRNLQCIALSALRAGLADDPGRTTAMWHLVCGTWAAVLYSPSFWADLELRTAREVWPEQIRAARDEQIRRVYRELRERASGAEGAITALYRELEQRWSLEVEVTERLARIDLPPGVLACGPMLLDRVADPETGSDAGRELAAAVRAAADPHTTELLAPLGRFRHLIDTGRLDEAITGLTVRAGLAGPDATPGVPALLAEARIAQAREFGEHGAWTETLACLELAGPLPADAARLAADAGIGAADAVLAADGADHRGAARVLERAALLAPDSTRLRERLGTAYAHMSRREGERGRHPAAIALVRKALELVPDDPLVRGFAGIALRERAAAAIAADTDVSVAEAVDLNREAFALDPGESGHVALRDALVLHAERLAVRRGAREDAVAAMREALELDDVDDAGEQAPRRMAAFLVDRALSAEQDGEFDRAIALLDESRHYVDDLAVRRSLAFNHYYAHHYDAAEKLLRREITDAPHDDPLRDAWVVVVTDWGYDLLAAGRAYDAINVLATGLRLYEDARIRDALVAVYLEDERYQDAISTLEAAPATPKNTEMLALALHNEGVRQANMGHNHTALTHLERALELHETKPGQEILDEVRARIHGYY